MRSVPGLKSASLWMSGLLVVSVGVIGAFLGANGKVSPSPATARPAEKEQIKAMMRRLPLTFQENRGQAASNVRFLTRGAGYTFWMSPTSTTVALARLDAGKPGEPRPASVLRMHMVGASEKARVTGAGKREGYTNYLIGPDKSKWIKDIPNYTRVRYEGIYPGINLEYYGSQQELEHDFIVQPGADPSQIRLAYEGSTRLEITPQGELHIHTHDGVVEQKKPYTYQEIGGKRREVESRYTLLAKNEIAFEVGDYDPSVPLVIDPVLRYNTYVGGSHDDYGFDIAIDADRNVYVTGYTGSYSQDQDNRPSAVPAAEGGARPNIEALAPFPTLNPYQTDPDATFTQRDLSNPGTGTGTIDGRWNYSFYDAFVFKLNPNGSGLVFSTYLGAEGDDYGFGIAVDSNRNPYITGRTNSAFWPLQLPVQGNGGGADAFVVKLNPNGNGVVYSTYLGGSGTDWGRSIEVDTTGNAHIAGFTSSNDFPTFRAAQPTYGGGARDIFVTSLDASGSAYNYSTYLGGSGDEGGRSSVVDLDYRAPFSPYQVPLPNPYSGQLYPTTPATPAGQDYTVDIAVDPQGNAYVCGGTTSTEGSGFPVTAGVVGPSHAQDTGGFDAFVVRYLPDGVISYSTFIGGSGDEAARSIAINNAGEAFITGYTSSPDFPVLNAFQPNYHDNVDAFVVKLNATATELIYSTYLGGAEEDIGNGIAISSGGQAYVVGSTTSPSTGLNGFPTANVFQSSSNGGKDIFVTKFRPDGQDLEFSTYLGGSNDDRALSIVVDGRGQPYFTGITSSSNIPTALGSMDRSINTGSTSGFTNYGPYPVADVFVAKFHAPPFAASNLIATDVQQTSISIAWTDESDNEDGFEIERKFGDGPTGTWTVIAQVGQDQVTFTNTGLISTTTYSYRIRPFNFDNNGTIYYGPYSNQLVVTTLPTAPASPTNFTATALDTQRIRLDWTDAANNEESYVLERRIPPAGIFTVINGGNPLPGSNPPASTGTGMTFTDTGLTANTTYEYRLRARNVAGDSTAPFPTVQATTLSPAPTVAPEVTATAVSNAAINVAWTYEVDPADHIGFKIYRKGPGDTDFLLIRTTSDQGTTFSDTGLSANSEYCYRVRSYNAAGDGPLSDPLTGVCATTLPDPPAAPTNLTATLVPPVTASLSWMDNSTDEDGFKVDLSTDNFVTVLQTVEAPAHLGTGLVDSFEVPNLAPNTIYYFRVRAFARNMGGDSDSLPTNVACVVTQPAAPIDLALMVPAPPAGSTSIIVSWMDTNPASNLMPSYRVERAVDDGMGNPGAYTVVTGTPIGTQGGPWSLTDTGLQSNTRYHYRVTAYNNSISGCSPTDGSSSDTVGPQNALTRPATPTLLSVENIAPTTSLRITWMDNSPTSTGFRLERSLDAGFTMVETVLTTNPGDPTTYDDTTTEGNLTYYYRVVAFNDTGDSAPSDVVSRLTLPAQPGNFTANAGQDPNSGSRIQVTLNWQDGSAAPTAFEVQISTDGVNFTPAPGSPTGVGATSLVIGGLDPNTVYCFRVRGINASGGGEWSDTVCPPIGPTGLTAVAISDTEILLTWEDRSDNEAAFRIERVTGISFATGINPTSFTTAGPNVTTYTDSGLTPNTTYTYRVVAISGTGNSAPSREAGATTFRTPPASAADLVVTPLSATQIKLDWTHNGVNLSGFKLERKEEPSGSFVTVGTIDGALRTYTDSGRKSNTTYTYRLTATNMGSDAAPVTGTGLTYPATPSGLVVSQAGSTQLNLTWNDNSSNPSDFKIERKEGAGGFVEIGTTTAPENSFQDMGLAPGTTYTYRVIATNATGDSAPSNEATGMTLPLPPGVPMAVTVQPVSQTSLRVNWTYAGNDETGFKIERSATGTDGWILVGTAVQDATTFLDQGLLPETTYYYRVIATNAGGDSAPSSVASGTTLPNAPSAPSGLTVTVPAAPAGSSELVLNWNDNSTNETGFKIERSTDSFANPANTVLVTTTAAGATSYTDTGLSADTVYYYRVRATNAAGDSASSNVASGRTLPAAPAAPSGLTVTPLSSTSLRIDWADNSNNESGFKLERSLDGVMFTQIATPSANATSYTDNGLTPATRYYYRVRSWNAGGDSAYSNTGDAFTFPVPPTAPSDLTATAVSSSSIALTWKDNSSTETGFKIERKTGTGFFVEIHTTGADEVSFTDTGLQADTEYIYRVRATNNGGNSGYSNEAAATTLPNAPDAPGSLAGTPLSQTEIQLTWIDNSANETGFKIERSTDGINFSLAGTVGADVTTFTDTGRVANTTYHYRVKATNAGGDSAASNTVTVTTLPNPPSAPANLVATTLSGTSVQLNWLDTSDNESGFLVERKEQGGTFGQIAQLGADVTTYVDNGLTPGVIYVYRVRAFNNGGNSAYTNEASTETTPNPPAAPTAVSVVALSSTSLRFDWVDNSDNETGFIVERRTGGGAFAVVTTVAANTTSFTDNGLTANTTYTYRVTATNGGGNSAPSSEVSGTTLPNAPAAPTNLVVSVLSLSEIGLTWNDNSDNETGFRIERRVGSDKNAPFVLIATVAANVTSYVDSDVASGVTYTYRVYAFNAGGSSAPTAEVGTSPVGSGRLKVSVKKLKFPKTRVGNTRTKQFRIKNNGTSTLLGNVGSLGEPFTVVQGGGAFSLAPGNSLVVAVQFAPTSNGKVKGALTITSTDPARQTVNVNVVGQGTGAGAAGRRK